MRRLLLIAIAALAVTGCNNTAVPPELGPGSVTYWHDDAHRVSCWLFGRGGGGYTAAISCLPDSQVSLP